MRSAALSFALLWLTGCAYVGDPLPPALRVPTPVTDLAARQVGGEILISFTIPASTMENLPLSTLGAIDLRIGKNPSEPFEANAWSAAATPVEAPLQGPGSFSLKLPVKDWADQEVILGVRLANTKRRLSPWSNLISLKVVPPLVQAGAVRAQTTAAGVQLEWEQPNRRPAHTWKLFRQSAGEAEPLEMVTVKEPTFLDTGAEFDRLHTYTIQTLEGAATSRLSEALGVTPVDSFPPAVPQGLSILAGPAAAQLSWERNQEPDLGGYRIYRAGSDGEFSRLAESPSAANYRDAAVSPGQTYRYRVTAVDKKGNESPQSEAVEILIP